MKTRTLGLWLLSGSLSAVASTGCEVPCDERGTCGPYVPDSGDDDPSFAGRASGGSGNAGAPAAAGSIGSGGFSGKIDAPGGSAGSTSSSGGAGSAGENVEGGAGGTESEVGTVSGSGGAPNECDPNASPRAELCALEGGALIFVSPSGGEAGDGSRDTPLASVGAAITLARSTGRSIVLCQGTYAEQAHVTGSIAVRIYGGFDCENGWALGTERSVIAPASGPALTIANASGDVVIEGVELRAAAAAGDEVNSIAVVVQRSANVTFRDSRVVAADGRDGINGESWAPYTKRAANGTNAHGTFGGSETRCSCPLTNEISKGGKGGDADPDGAGPETEGGGDYGEPENGNGKGGLPGQDCAGRGSGAKGTPAAALDDVGKGADSYGAWVQDVWVPTDGTVGFNGTPGQGGGGGRGGESGGGGGGACGGCGGKAGLPGTGGGASIAIVSIRSNLTLESTELVTGNGGKGGLGLLGQAGQEGGFGGSQQPSACPGGPGGRGAAGSTGGGGAGGISVGVLYQGAAPLQADVQIQLGEPGAGGKGASDWTDEDDGISGTAEQTYELS